MKTILSRYLTSPISLNVYVFKLAMKYFLKNFHIVR